MSDIVTIGDVFRLIVYTVFWVFIMYQIAHFTDSVRAIAKKMKDHRDDKTDLDL